MRCAARAATLPSRAKSCPAGCVAPWWVGRSRTKPLLPDESASAMKSLLVLPRAVARLAGAVIFACWGWMIIMFAFPHWPQERRDARVQRWAIDMLHILGVSLKVEGAPPSRGPALLVANHISWLDILVIHAARHCRFVSKAQV